MLENEELINNLAQRLTMREPRVEVLNNRIINQYLPIVRALDISFRKRVENKSLLLPELREDGNESIAIYSDYGGESPDSRYLTYSVLVCGWNHSYSLPEYMSKIRKKYNLKDKEISFKDLKFGPISRSLSDYLRVLNNSVVGLLVNVVIDKKVDSFYGRNIPSYILEDLEDREMNAWKPKITGKVIRIVHIVSYIIALLSKDSHKLYWVTDHDAIAESKDKHEKLVSFLQSALTLYTDNRFPVIGYSTPFNDRDINQLDFLSCADIAAGALEQYFTRRKKLNSVTVKPGTNKILKWLSSDGICLKKHTILIEENDDGVITIGEVKFSNDEVGSKSHKVAVRVSY